MLLGLGIVTIEINIYIGERNDIGISLRGINQSRTS